MFFRRPFLIILFISLGWHIFWMAAVSIVILPGRFSTNNYKAVNFLGPLLKEISIVSVSAPSPSFNFNLKDKIEALTGSFHPEIKEEGVPRAKESPQPYLNIKEEKFSPERIVLVTLPVEGLREKRNLPTDKSIKYSVSADGRVFSLGRPTTSSEVENDILNMRRLWPERFYP